MEEKYVFVKMQSLLARSVLLTINANKFFYVIRTTKRIKFDCTLYLHVESQLIIIFDVCNSHNACVELSEKFSIFRYK